MFSAHSKFQSRNTPWSSNLTASIKNDSCWKACIPFPCRYASNLNEAIYKTMNSSASLRFNRNTESSNIVNSTAVSQSVKSLTSHPLMYDKEMRTKYRSSSSVSLNSPKQTTINSFNDVFKMDFCSNPYSSSLENHSDFTQNNSHLNVSTRETNSVVQTANGTKTVTKKCSTVNKIDSFQFDEDEFINIVDLFSIDSHHIKKVLDIISSTYMMPKNALFYFEGYDGFNQKDKLIQDIKQKAFRHGTVLITHKINKPNVKNPHYTVTLVCDHFGKPKKSETIEKSFADGCLQASGTIIQQSHYCSSIKELKLFKSQC